MKKKIAMTVIWLAALVCCLLLADKMMRRDDGERKYGAFFEDKLGFDVLFMGTSRVLDAVLETWGAYVTMENSVLMGNSGGGTATWYTACLEHRFAVYMPSCAVCTFRDSIIAMQHCSCNYVPNLAKWMDMGDMAVMIAPKKLVIVCGKDDPIFPLHGVKETWETVKNLYAAAGTPDNCRLVIGEGSHRFYADDAWPVVKELL
jgi:hypothetical protein